MNGEEIEPGDRGYYEHIEYLWTYGDQSERAGVFSNLAEDRVPVTGWIGTIKHPRFLRDEEGENLNRIAIFMRGKLAQEDVLADFGQKEIYADYVVGDIYCDDEDDIATSSRQSLKYDDPRFEAVRNIILRVITDRS